MIDGCHFIKSPHKRGMRFESRLEQSQDVKVRSDVTTVTHRATLLTIMLKGWQRTLKKIHALKMLVLIYSVDSFSILKNYYLAKVRSETIRKRWNIITYKPRQNSCRNCFNLHDANTFHPMQQYHFNNLTNERTIIRIIDNTFEEIDSFSKIYKYKL